MPAETVTQKMLWEFLKEVGPMEVDEIALQTDQHEITVRRKCDGLVCQGKMEMIPAIRGERSRMYRAIGEEYGS